MEHWRFAFVLAAAIIAITAAQMNMFCGKYKTILFFTFIDFFVWLLMAQSFRVDAAVPNVFFNAVYDLNLLKKVINSWR